MKHIYHEYSYILHFYVDIFLYRTIQCVDIVRIAYSSEENNPPIFVVNIPLSKFTFDNTLL